MRAKPLLGLIFLLAAPSAQADIADEVKSRLSVAEVLRGDFSQVKAIKGLKKPLRSSGNFVLARRRGVLWHTEKPLKSELRVSRDGLRQRREGKTVLELKAGSQPGLKMLSEVLFSVFSADLAGLRSTFEMSGSTTKKGWKVSLTPKPGPAAKAVKRITLEGTSAVQILVLDEAGGDQARVTFAQVREDKALTPDEEAAFAP